ncbi:uncharacterized protein C8A04DRAFT_9897 [Dichotomopilus funicola]|uniref:DUF7729 domain-containing protein n=1 Tax=Dichotomopilus funicola TaxID=1934379 RepID=A0AAN6V8G4_9PEZI|nr:hypothetical protein C8A04DRAFT_9897 [Dichotomopilus funicola]
MTCRSTTSAPAYDVPRRPHRSSLPTTHRRLTTPWAVVLLVLACLVSHAVAAAPDHARLRIETPILHRGSAQGNDRVWAKGVEDAVAANRRTVPRQVAVQEEESTTTTDSSSEEPSETAPSRSVTTTFTIGVGTASPSKTTSVASSTIVSASPLPRILDSIAANFQKGPNGEAPTCPIFINSFLADPNFKQCYPLSMLFEQSTSFFDAQHSLVGITRTLDATCAADVTFCTSYLRQLASNLTLPENCGADYALGNPVVTDTHLAMLAYAPVYGAGCLRDPATGAYCYANAITNQTNVSAPYFYFLPLNKTLPGTTVPQCGACLQRTMALYKAATADRSQPIAATYQTAAEQVNVICGPGFVNESLAAEVVPSSGAAGAVGGVAVVARMWGTVLLALGVAEVVWLG